MTLTTPSSTSHVARLPVAVRRHQCRGRCRPRPDLGRSRPSTSGGDPVLHAPARPGPCPGRAPRSPRRPPRAARGRPPAAAPPAGRLSGSVSPALPSTSTPGSQRVTSSLASASGGVDQSRRPAGVGPGPQPLPVGAQLTLEVMVRLVARLDDVRRVLVPQPEHRRADQSPAEVLHDLVSREPAGEQLPLPHGGSGWAVTATPGQRPGSKRHDPVEHPDLVDPVLGVVEPVRPVVARRVVLDASRTSTA